MAELATHSGVQFHAPGHVTACCFPQICMLDFTPRICTYVRVWYCHLARAQKLSGIQYIMRETISV